MDTTVRANSCSENKNQQDDKILLQPSNHFKQLPPRNDFVTKLWLAYNYWFQVPKEQFKEISILGNKLIDAVLLMDDLVDNSKVRRGILASHLVYGSSRTIYSNIYSTFLTVSKFSEPKVIDNLIATCLNMFEGQAMEMCFANSGICPSEEEYKRIVEKKTTPVFSLSFCLQQTFATKHRMKNFDKFLTSLGLFFQICNDYISLVSHTYVSVKIFGDDITEGRFTFPMIHGIKTRPEDHRLMNILKQRTSDEKMKLHLIELLEEFGSLAYTLQTLAKLKNQCVEEIRKVAENSELEKVLEDAFTNIGALTM